MLSRRTLRNRLQEVDLKPEEAWAMVERVKAHTSSAEDHERLGRVVSVTTSVLEQLRTEPIAPEPASSKRPSAERVAKRKRQWAKAARRRQRR